MKLVVEADSRRVLGVHIVGHGAAEMIQLAAVAVRMGATKDDFDAHHGRAPDLGRGARDHARRRRMMARVTRLRERAA